MKNLVGAVLGVALVLPASMPVSAQETDLTYYGITFEQAEYRYRVDNESDLVVWSGDAFIGTDDWKFRVQSEAERVLRNNTFEKLEHQFLVQTPISTFFDVKAGIRADTPKGPDRFYGVVGIQGLAPQWFEVDVDMFLSEDGEFSARLDADYELLLTNRLILTPTAEVNVGWTNDAGIGEGSGLRDIELGLRLSYDLIDRTVAPYVGLSYERSFGRTASFARREGEDIDALFIVGGIRVMF